MANRWYSMIFGDDNRVARPLLTGKDDFHGVDPYDLEVGKRIPKWNPESSVRATAAEDDGEPDDILGDHLGIPIFSARLRLELLKRNIGKDDIQYLPLRVFKSTGEEIKGFCIANVLARLAALDYENSQLLDLDETEIDPLTGKRKVLGVWTAGLRREALGGHDVFRLLEFFPMVFGSDRFVALFRSKRFTGATFEEAPVL